MHLFRIVCNIRRMLWIFVPYSFIFLNQCFVYINSTSIQTLQNAHWSLDYGYQVCNVVCISWIPSTGYYYFGMLTYWGRVMHIIYVSILTIIGSDNGLSSSRRWAIIWTNAGILLIRAIGTNCNEILCENHIFSFKKMPLKMSSVKWRQFCLGLSLLIISCLGNELP